MTGGPDEKPDDKPEGAPPAGPADTGSKRCEREERQAAALRENLRRRNAQRRAQRGPSPESGGGDGA